MREAHTKVSVSLDWGHQRIGSPAQWGWVRDRPTAQWLDQGIDQSGSQPSNVSQLHMKSQLADPSTFLNTHGFIGILNSQRKEELEIEIEFSLLFYHLKETFLWIHVTL